MLLLIPFVEECHRGDVAPGKPKRREVEISGKFEALTGRRFVMKRSRYTEEQIAFALKQAELGTAVAEVCRKMGVSEATFYNWKKKYGGLGVSELRRLKQLEEENTRLKRMVADLSLDKQMLQEVIQKKL